MLHLIGLNSVHVGDSYETATKEERLTIHKRSKIAIDIIAYPPSRDEIFLCQCTTEWQTQKVIDLKDTLEEIRNTIGINHKFIKKIYGLIFTVTPRTKIEQTVKNTIQDDIKVLTLEDLLALLDDVRKQNEF